MKNVIAVSKKPVDPIQGMVIYDAVLNEMQVFTGVTWQKVDVSNPQYCVVCGHVTHQVEMVDGKMLIPDHPFCGDNLVYLEWQVEKRERRQVR